MVSIYLRSFLIVWFLSVPLSAHELTDQELDEIFEKSRSPQSRSFDFKEIKSMRLLKEPMVSEGTLIISPPNRFRREIKTPHPSLTVSDGQTLWLYYSAFSEAEKYDLKKTNPISKTLEVISASFSPEKLRRLFEVSGSSAPNGYTLLLKPKNSAIRRNITELRLKFSPELNLKESILTATDGSQTLTRYENEKRVTPAHKIFQFDPPAGTSVREPLK